MLSVRFSYPNMSKLMGEFRLDITAGVFSLECDAPLGITLEEGSKTPFEQDESRA